MYEFNRKNPAFERVVILLTVNKKKMTERVIIGEAGEVRLRLERNSGEVFYDETHKLGAFLFNFESNHERDWNINIMQIHEKGFKARLSEKAVPKSIKPCADFLRQKYENGEPSAMFAAINIWENYLKCYNVNHGADIFKDKSAITAFTNMFKKFRREAIKRKNEVKSGKMKMSVFTSWLAEQQNVVDGVVKRGGEKWTAKP